MNNKAFIQVGQRFFATAHIAAIVLDATIGCNERPAVALYLGSSEEPWKFEHGTPEAGALTAYAQSNAECLAQPEYEIK